VINGYTWRSGWFIDENSRGGNGDDYLVFSADGVTTNGYGIPDTTLATNRSETRADTKGTWDSEDRPNGIGDDVVFDFNQETIVITGLPDHPILGVEALDQTLDSEAQGAEWVTSTINDIVTVKFNSSVTNGNG
tara:strand:+ start:99 stop:500 length:402 start_codon:yes stop_codon:yes gene_type:complete